MTDIRTPQQKEAQDAEASRLAQSLINTLVKLGVDPTIGANALAGALGAYVAMAADETLAPQMMRLMASVAREQMELQLAIQRAEQLGVVGRA